jgi:hypothetical protein
MGARKKFYNAPVMTRVWIILLLLRLRYTWSTTVFLDGAKSLEIWRKINAIPQLAEQL